MAISVHATSATYDTANDNNETLAAHDCGATSNDRLIVIAASSQRTSGLTCTVGGNAATESVANSSRDVSIFTYKPEGVLTGNQNIVVYGTNAIFSIAAITLYGVNQTTPVGDTDETSGTGTSTSLTLTTTSGDYVVDAMYNELDNGASMAADGGQTEVQNQEINSNQTRCVSYEVASGASTAVGWSWTGSYAYYQIALVIQPTVTVSGPATLKTRNTTAVASVKTLDTTAIASVKTIDTIS